jgi:hypothetical protein
VFICGKRNSANSQHPLPRGAAEVSGVKLRFLARHDDQRNPRSLTRCCFDSNAKSLAKAEKWQHLGAFDGDDGEVVWGEIKVRRAKPIAPRVALDAEKFDCSCPSRNGPANTLSLLRCCAKMTLPDSEIRLPTGF